MDECSTRMIFRFADEDVHGVPRRNGSWLWSERKSCRREGGGYA